MLTWPQAEKLAPTDFWSGIAQSVYKDDELFEVLPFARVAGKAHTYVREGAEINAHWIPPGGVVQIPAGVGVAQLPGPVRRALQQRRSAAGLPRVVGLLGHQRRAMVVTQVAARVLATEVGAARTDSGDLLERQRLVVEGDAPQVGLDPGDHLVEDHDRLVGRRCSGADVADVVQQRQPRLSSRHKRHAGLERPLLIERL